MNKIVNKFLLAGDKFLPEMHLREPRFRCCTWWSLTKKIERIQKFEKQEIHDKFIKTN